MATCQCSIIGPFFNIGWVSNNWSWNLRHSPRAGILTSAACSRCASYQEQLEQQRVDFKLKELLMEKQIQQLQQEVDLRLQKLEQERAGLHARTSNVKSTVSSLDGGNTSRSVRNDSASVSATVRGFSSRCSAGNTGSGCGKSRGQSRGTTCGSSSGSSGSSGKSGDSSSCSKMNEEVVGEDSIDKSSGCGSSQGSSNSGGVSCSNSNGSSFGSRRGSSFSGSSVQSSDKSGEPSKGQSSGTNSSSKNSGSRTSANRIDSRGLFGCSSPAATGQLALDVLLGASTCVE